MYSYFSAMHPNIFDVFKKNVRQLSQFHLTCLLVGGPTAIHRYCILICQVAEKK